MQLTPGESRFITRRASMGKYWPIAGWTLIVMLLGLASWLWYQVPLFVNPWEVAHALETDMLPDPSLYLMAILLPVVVLAILVLTASGILLAWRVFANERQLLEIIKKLQAGCDSPSS